MVFKRISDEIFSKLNLVPNLFCSANTCALQVLRNQRFDPFLKVRSLTDFNINGCKNKKKLLLK